MFANAQIDADKGSSENRPSRCDHSTVIYYWRGCINVLSITVNTTRMVQVIYRQNPSAWLAGTLLFFLPHSLSQQLANVGQGVRFGSERPDRVAETADLRFTGTKAKPRSR